MSEHVHARITESGRVVIPVEYRRALGIEGGTEVILTRDEYGIHITPLDQAIRRAQELVAEYIPSEVDLRAELRRLRNEEGSLD
jgi:AbrB family looped-hinge helix DNA binding protein